jgi:predicted dehydrogenase
MKDDLLIGVIGSGGRGAMARLFHMPGKGARVTACCDTNTDIFAHNREWYGTDVFTTTDYHELLDQNIDVVFVTTPDYLHEEHAIAALEAGKVVYLEKPMAISIAACDRILETARVNNGRLYLGQETGQCT